MALPLLLVACTESTELDNIEQTSEEVYPELDFSCESPSRAVVSSFEPGAKIGVFVTDKGTTNGYGGNASNMNITYTLNGDSYWEAGYNTALTNSEANVYGIIRISQMFRQVWPNWRTVWTSCTLQFLLSSAGTIRWPKSN